jgi:hypothetical protein
VKVAADWKDQNRAIRLEFGGWQYGAMHLELWEALPPNQDGWPRLLSRLLSVGRLLCLFRLRLGIGIDGVQDVPGDLLVISRLFCSSV